VLLRAAFAQAASMYSVRRKGAGGTLCEPLEWLGALRSTCMRIKRARRATCGPPCSSSLDQDRAVRDRACHADARSPFPLRRTPPSCRQAHRPRGHAPPDEPPTSRSTNAPHQELSHTDFADGRHAAARLTCKEALWDALSRLADGCTNRICIKLSIALS
jgi:hypothetical protein